MQSKFVEATNGARNWGKFMIGRFTSEEWSRKANVPNSPHTIQPLLCEVGWTPEHIVVMDLQTGEGAIFRPGGFAPADLNKHRIWVCPMFEPFLEWLYKQNLSDLDKLPGHVDLPDAPFAMSGYRREGP